MGQGVPGIENLLCRRHIVPDSWKLQRFVPLLEPGIIAAFRLKLLVADCSILTKIRLGMGWEWYFV